MNRSDPSGLDWDWVVDNYVEIDKGHWEEVPGTDNTVPRPLSTFTPRDNGGSSRFTWGDAGNLLGFYSQRGNSTTSESVKSMYSDAASEVAEMAWFRAAIDRSEGRQTSGRMASINSLIGAYERFDAHMARGQTIENLLVGGINFFDPHKTPFGVALRVTGEVLAPLEQPLIALSAPGVMNSPMPAMKGVGMGSALLSRLPMALRGTRFVMRAEELTISAEIAVGSRLAVLKQYEAFADPRIGGTFTADAPLMLQRSGFLGRLGLKSPVYTGGTMKLRPGLSAADEAEILAHEGAHARFTFQHPELKYLQSSQVPGVRGISAFVDELQAYRAGLGGGFHPGRAWQSLIPAERRSLILTPAAAGGSAALLYYLWSE